MKIFYIMAVSILFSPIANAQEATDVEIPLSSEAKAQQMQIEEKNKVMNDVNRKIYNTKNERFMREYVRNSNAMKEIMEQPTKDVDIKDKKALSKYMQEELGLDGEIVEVKENNSEDIKPSYSSRAAKLLK